jgi:hypothetical protein
MLKRARSSTATCDLPSSAALATRDARDAADAAMTSFFARFGIQAAR